MGLLYHHCNWASTRWQWSVNAYKNRKETVLYKTMKNTEYRKQKTIMKNKKANIKRNIKNIGQVISKQHREASNNEILHRT